MEWVQVKLIAFVVELRVQKNFGKKKQKQKQKQKFGNSIQPIQPEKVNQETIYKDSYYCDEDYKN